MALTTVSWATKNVISLTKMTNMVNNTIETWNETDKIVVLNAPAKDYGTGTLSRNDGEVPTGFYNNQFYIQVGSGATSTPASAVTYTVSGLAYSGSGVGYHQSENLDISTIADGLTYVRITDGTNHRYARFWKTTDMDYLSWWVYLGSETVPWDNGGTPTNATVYYRSDLTILAHRTAI